MKEWYQDGVGTWEYTNINNVRSTIRDFIADNNVTEIEIPSSINELQVLYFSFCTYDNRSKRNNNRYPNLKKVIIQDGINEINFIDSPTVEEIIIPESVKEINQGAFQDCTSLKEITIPKNVKFIGIYAFCNCSSLNKVNIQEGMEAISAFTFLDCISLKEMDIPESVKTIYEKAFYNCKNLKKVVIPKDIVEMGDEIFGKCDSLEEINISSLDNWEVVKESLLNSRLRFNKNRKSLTIKLKGDNKEDVSVTVSSQKDLKALTKAHFTGIDLIKNRTEINKKKWLGSAAIIVGGLSALAFVPLAPIVAGIITAVGAAFLIAGSIAVHRARKRGNAQDYFVAANEKTNPDIAEIGEKTVAVDFRLSPWYNRAREAKDTKELNKILIPKMLGQEEQIEP